MSVRISIDPGLSGTGLAVWRGGECIEISTIYPQKTGEEIERLIDLKAKLVPFFNRFADEGISCVAIEKFQRFVRRPNMLAMMSCSAARAICIGTAYDWADEVIDIDKGREPKRNAGLASLAYGHKGSQHARDALHLGICAGFDRRGA